ncbi:Cytochrome c [Lacunisphaera limnophila]|uniref:Cytochrome c n=1 Tax=Lacunisphaera limnophila TaxID=1838286 RepID=A0A1I7PHF3_9BACT|nr:c-type cytochrome [Lacunisphaera limnophila]AOS43032.1 Cytochrome c [Lacunisphaera limnophila]
MLPPPRTRPADGKILGVVLLGLCGLAVGATIFLQVEKQPESSPVTRGARLAEEAGCFACHGRSEEEPRFNLRLAAPGQWRGKNNPSLWEGEITEVKVLVDWITNGVPADEVEKHKQLFIRMPAYRDRLSAAEIEDIAAWILAEGLKLRVDPGARTTPAAPGAALTPDQLFVAGDRLARQTGCYQCHGELGQGGVANPASFKGYIPGFQGQDFLKLTADGDRSEILHWIDHGRGRAIEAGLLGRIAKKYFDGQAIPMPGYRDQLTPAEKERLADFLLLINQSGPLPAREIERLNAVLDPR